MRPHPWPREGLLRSGPQAPKRKKVTPATVTGVLELGAEGPEQKNEVTPLAATKN